MTEIGQEIALTLEHRYAAPREQVFDAWTSPEVLKRWWAAMPTWDTPLAEVDAREGGRYRLSMRTDEGAVHTVSGEYTEVSPPERLAYTWSWEEGPDAAMAGSERSLVVVDFLEDGGGTREGPRRRARSACPARSRRGSRAACIDGRSHRRDALRLRARALVGAPRRAARNLYGHVAVTSPVVGSYRNAARRDEPNAVLSRAARVRRRARRGSR